MICSGDSDTQVRAIADYIVSKLETDHKISCWHIEGYENGRWVLLDYGDVIIHIFDEESRRYYELERLWGDAPIVLGKLP